MFRASLEGGSTAHTPGLSVAPWPWRVGRSVACRMWAQVLGTSCLPQTRDLPETVEQRDPDLLEDGAVLQVHCRVNDMTRWAARGSEHVLLGWSSHDRPSALGHRDGPGCPDEASPGLQMARGHCSVTAVCGTEATALRCHPSFRCAGWGSGS